MLWRRENFLPLLRIEPRFLIFEPIAYSLYQICYLLSLGRKRPAGSSIHVFWNYEESEAPSRPWLNGGQNLRGRSCLADMQALQPFACRRRYLRSTTACIQVLIKPETKSYVAVALCNLSCLLLCYNSAICNIRCSFSTVNLSEPEAGHNANLSLKENVYILGDLLSRGPKIEVPVLGGKFLQRKKNSGPLRSR